MLELARSAAEQDAAPLSTRLFWLRDGPPRGRRRDARVRGTARTSIAIGEIAPTFRRVTAWATDLEFAYDHGHLYVVDAESHWSEAEVDVRMPRSANFFVPLRVEGWGGRPPLDLDALGPGHRVLADGPVRQARAGVGRDRRGDGRHRARRLPRALERPQPERGGDVGRATRTRRTAYRLQIWPGATEAPRAEIKHWPGIGRSELGDLPALLADEELDALGAIVGSERTGDGAAAQRAPGRRQTARTWDRTIRADGVVRWVVSSSRFHRAGAARRAPRPAALHRRLRRPLLPRPRRGPASGSPTRCAPRTRSSPAATSASRRS